MGNNFLLFTINQSQMKLNLILLILELTSMDPTIKLQVKYREGKLSSKLRGNVQKKQARIAHSSAFCIDLH